jgi:transposase-like protein
MPLDYACPSPACENNQYCIYKHANKYRKFGLTSNGKQRFQCTSCKKTFSLTPKASRQKYSYKNKTIFKLLMNYVPFRRILEISDIHFQTLYDKIDFIEKRCLKFLQYKESAFANETKLERIYLGCDQQFFTLNWTSTYEKRNIILRAVSTCDNDYRYCFGIHLNYDPNVDATEIDRHSEEIQDHLLPPAYRTYARVWLEADYWEALKKSYRKATSKHKNLIESQVYSKYLDALLRDDIEVPPDAHENSQLPHQGVQVHSEYTLYGHFFFLQSLFAKIEKVRFFVDQDSGMRAACLSAFVDRIRSRSCDVFYISTDNDVSIHERKKINQRSADLINETMAQNGFSHEYQARRFLLASAIEGATPIGKWQDRWVKFPYSHGGELHKMACHLTNYNDYDLEHLVNLYLKASIHATDSFFQLTRRRLRLVERPLKTVLPETLWVTCSN